MYVQNKADWYPNSNPVVHNKKSPTKILIMSSLQLWCTTTDKLCQHEYGLTNHKPLDNSQHQSPNCQISNHYKKKLKSWKEYPNWELTNTYPHPVFSQHFWVVDVPFTSRLVGYVSSFPGSGKTLLGRWLFLFGSLCFRCFGSLVLEGKTIPFVQPLHPRAPKIPNMMGLEKRWDSFKTVDITLVSMLDFWADFALLDPLTVVFPVPQKSPVHC